MALREAFEGCLSKLGLIRTVIVLLQLSHSCRQTDAGRLQTYRICIAFDLNYMIFFLTAPSRAAARAAEFCSF